jgi:hypothetical protein
MLQIDQNYNLSMIHERNDETSDLTLEYILDAFSEIDDSLQNQTCDLNINSFTHFQCWGFDVRNEELSFGDLLRDLMDNNSLDLSFKSFTCFQYAGFEREVNSIFELILDLSRSNKPKISYFNDLDSHPSLNSMQHTNSFSFKLLEFNNLMTQIEYLCFSFLSDLDSNLSCFFNMQQQTWVEDSPLRENPVGFEQNTDQKGDPEKKEKLTYDVEFNIGKERLQQGDASLKSNEQMPIRESISDSQLNKQKNEFKNRKKQLLSASKNKRRQFSKCRNKPQVRVSNLNMRKRSLSFQNRLIHHKINDNVLSQSFKQSQCIGNDITLPQMIQYESNLAILKTSIWPDLHTQENSALFNSNTIFNNEVFSQLYENNYNSSYVDSIITESFVIFKERHNQAYTYTTKSEEKRLTQEYHNRITKEHNEVNNELDGLDDISSTELQLIEEKPEAVEGEGELNEENIIHDIEPAEYNYPCIKLGNIRKEIFPKRGAKRRKNKIKKVKHKVVPPGSRIFLKKYKAPLKAIEVLLGKYLN